MTPLHQVDFGCHKCDLQSQTYNGQSGGGGGGKVAM